MAAHQQHVAPMKLCPLGEVDVTCSQVLGYFFETLEGLCHVLVVDSTFGCTESNHVALICILGVQLGTLKVVMEMQIRKRREEHNLKPS